MVETRITVGKDVINIPASPFILRVVGIGYREAVFVKYISAISCESW